jgi:hypothetical protein
VLNWSRDQVEIMHPGPYNRAIRSVVADLAATHDGTMYLGTSVSGLRQRYDLGSEHDLVGRSVPEVEVVPADGWPSCRTTGGACRSATSLSTTTARTSRPQRGPGHAGAPGRHVAWVEGRRRSRLGARRWFGGVPVG